MPCFEDLDRNWPDFLVHTVAHHSQSALWQHSQILKQIGRLKGSKSARNCSGQAHTVQYGQGFTDNVRKCTTLINLRITDIDILTLEDNRRNSSSVYGARTTRLGL